MVEDKDSSRRNVIRMVGSSLAISGVAAGSVKGKSNEGSNGRPDNGSRKDKEKKTAVVNESNRSGAIELKRSNAGSKQEWEEHIQERKENRNHESEISPDSVGGDPDGDTRYLDHWKHERDHTVEFQGPCCPTGTTETVVDSEQLCTLYETIEDGSVIQDGNGDYYYLVELYAQAEAHDTPWGFSRGRIQHLNHSLEVLDGRDRYFEKRDPSTTSDVNGEYVTVQEEMTVGSVTWTAEDIIYLHDGTFGPTTWTPGDDGQYGAEWKSDGDDMDDGVDEKQELLAYVTVRSEQKLDEMDHNGLSWEWTLTHNYHDSAPIQIP